MKPIIHLAPLHGITNRIFRKAYFAHFSGFDAVLAPFILSVNTSGQKKNHFKDIIPKESLGVRIIPQILSNDAVGFISTSQILTDAGYDEVNWNLGCPYPMVAKKKRGSGLLPHPDMIDKFLDNVCSRLKIPLSLKLRLGMKNAEEILALMPLLNRYPLKRIIVHARLGIQMYKGEVDLDGFSRAANLCTHPIMYNGDIHDFKSYECLRKRFQNIGEWMIGRGAIQDPFLASRIKSGLPVDNQAKIIKAFHDDIYNGYRSVLSGPAHVMDKMKEIWQYLGDSFPRNQKELERISRCHSLEAYERITSSIFIR